MLLSVLKPTSESGSLRDHSQMQQTFVFACWIRLLHPFLKDLAKQAQLLPSNTTNRYVAFFVEIHNCILSCSS